MSDTEATPVSPKQTRYVVSGVNPHQVVGYLLNVVEAIAEGRQYSDPAAYAQWHLEELDRLKWTELRDAV